MPTVKNKDGRTILLAMVKAIQENKQYLGDIDGIIGDGDHGMNMNKGFSVFEAQLGDKEISFSEGLFDLGSVLFNKIGGSMGPIYGAIFMEMSEKADGAVAISLSLFREMIESGLEGLYEIVEARPGDKTLVDTLCPVVESLKDSEGKNEDFLSALNKIDEAAQKGMNSTKELVAKFGRAARLGERSRGALDPGATSCCIILRAMAGGMKKALQ